jgi:hypothetical protein
MWKWSPKTPQFLCGVQFHKLPLKTHRAKCDPNPKPDDNCPDNSAIKEQLNTIANVP